LYRTNGEVLAVVEAKRTSREPRVGKQQVLEYVTAIEKKQSFRPFAFMANGEDGQNADSGFGIAEGRFFNPTSRFRIPKSSLLRIAISEDMLDTGGDFHEVVNLAFMEPVNSQNRFW
jgi:type I site-specific restriction endonuclease